MDVEIVADDNYAAFVCNTSGEAFGPIVNVPQHGEHANRQVAEEVLNRIEYDIKEQWHRNPHTIHRQVNDAKADLYPEVWPP